MKWFLLQEVLVDEAFKKSKVKHPKAVPLSHGLTVPNSQRKLILSQSYCHVNISRTKTATKARSTRQNNSLTSSASKSTAGKKQKQSFIFHGKKIGNNVFFLTNSFLFFFIS